MGPEVDTRDGNEIDERRRVARQGHNVGAAGEGGSVGEVDKGTDSQSEIQAGLDTSGAERWADVSTLRRKGR